MRLYSIFDHKAAVFGSPFVARNDQEAGRFVSASMMSPDNLIGMFPNDYDIYHVGSWDDQTGVVEREVQMLVFNCKNLVAKE